MTDVHGEMDLQEFQLLARDWTKWRETFERSDAALRDQQPMARQLPTMRALSRFRPMWELAVSSAAYSILTRPAFLASPKRTDLSMVSDALTTLPGRRALPGFDLMATEVSTLPYGALVRSVPRFAAALRDDQLLSATSFVRTLYCMERYPEGGAAFLLCLRSG